MVLKIFKEKSIPLPLSRLGLYRDAEAQFKSTLKHFSTVDMFLYLCKVYVKLDQPKNALDYFKKGLDKFENDTSLLTGIARIHEVCVWCVVCVRCEV